MVRASTRAATTRRPLLGWDVAVSGLALTLTVALIVAGAVGGAILVALLESCPPATCSSSRMLVSVLGGLVVAGAAGIAGLALTVLRVAERRESWPFSVTALMITTLVIVVAAEDNAGVIGF